MKRIFILLFFVSCISVVFGQTYYYRYLYHVDKDTGVKTKKESWVKSGGVYMTFTNNSSYCYMSDKDGFRVKYGGDSYRYIGNDNGRLTYYHSLRDTGNIFMQNYPLCYYYFSTDFSRLNTWNDCSDMKLGIPPSNDIVVYERAAAPAPKKNTPDRLW